MGIEDELRDWFGPGWTVAVTTSAINSSTVVIEDEHPLSHGVTFDQLAPDEAVQTVKRPGLGEQERTNVAAAPVETPHRELLMGLRVMIDAERLDAHDRDVVGTVLRGVGLLTRDEADWIRQIEPLL